jgi:hypothetical protein
MIAVGAHEGPVGLITPPPISGRVATNCPKKYNGWRTAIINVSFYGA